MSAATANRVSATVRHGHRLARETVRELSPGDARLLAAAWIEDPPVELRTMRVEGLLGACRGLSADHLLDLAEADSRINLRQLTVMQRKVLSALLRSSRRTSQ